MDDDAAGLEPAAAPQPDGAAKKLTRAQLREDPFYKLRREIHASCTANNLHEALASYQKMKTAESRVRTTPSVEVINAVMNLAAKECKLVG